MKANPFRCTRCAAFYTAYPPVESPDDDKLVHDLGDYTMDPITCAFRDGKFDLENWNCQTMNALRDVAELSYTTRRDDESIGVIHIPLQTVDVDPLVQYGYLVLTWYKRRGRTGGAIIVADTHPPEPLTLTTAEWLLGRPQPCKNTTTPTAPGKHPGNRC